MHPTFSAKLLQIDKNAKLLAAFLWVELSSCLLIAHRMRTVTSAAPCSGLFGLTYTDGVGETLSSRTATRAAPCRGPFGLTCSDGVGDTLSSRTATRAAPCSGPFGLTCADGVGETLSLRTATSAAPCSGHIGPTYAERVRNSLLADGHKGRALQWAHWDDICG